MRRKNNKMDENEKQLDGKNVKVLRTYTSDMADAIRTNEVSVIKIALAEKEKREQEATYKEAEGTNVSKTFLVIGGVILIVVAILGSYYLLQKKKSVALPTINNIETFIAYDSKSNIDVTNATNTNDLLNLINKDPQVDSPLIKALFLIRKTNSVYEVLTSNDFLSLIGATAPGALTRSLSDKYLLGKYSNPNATNEQNKSAMFLILETTDYNQAYASMLDWEKTMLKDLFVLFNISPPNNLLLEKPWKDIIINNKDARVLYGDNGEGILYYVFVNKNDLIITNNTESLREVMARLITKNAQPL